MKNFIFLLLLLILFSCWNEYKEATLKKGVYELSGISTKYNDYNSTGPQVFDYNNTFIYSTDYGTSGDNFNIHSANIKLYINDTVNEESEFSSKRLGEYKPELNSPNNEYGPFLYYHIFNDVLQLYDYQIYFFASDRLTDAADITEDLNIYYYYNNELKLFGGNSQYNDAYLTITGGYTVYFCSDRSGSYDIYKYSYSMTTHGDYSSLENASILNDSVPVDELNSTADEKCPYINGKYLFFVSNRAGGCGGYDIYYSILDSGSQTWSAPVNLGGKFNTAYNEFRPSVYYDNTIGNTREGMPEFCIFSSDRPRGKGGYDLYFAILKNSHVWY